MDEESKAEEKKEESAKDTEQASPPPSDNNSKMKLIVIMALCMVILSVTAMISTVVLTLNKDSNPAEVASKSDKSKETNQEEDTNDNSDDEYVDSRTPLFYQLLPTFVVNIPAKGRSKFLQVQVQIMTYDMKVQEKVEQYAPLIKNDLVQLFSKQEYEELIKLDGKEMLRAQALKIVKEIIVKHTGEDGVEQVLFTSFITQ